MKKLNITILLLFTVLLINGQNSSLGVGGAAPVSFTTLSNAANLENLMAENMKFGNFINSKKNLDGTENTTYFFDDSSKSMTVFTKDNNAYKVSNANYDMKSNKLLVLLDDGKVFSFSNGLIKNIKRENKTYVLLPGKGLAESVYAGDRTSLFRGGKLQKMQAMTNPLTNEVTKPAYFQKEDTYIMFLNGLSHELPSRKSKFLDLFGKNESKVKKFIKSNKLSISEEADVIKILSFIDKQE